MPDNDLAVVEPDDLQSLPVDLGRAELARERADLRRSQEWVERFRGELEKIAVEHSVTVDQVLEFALARVWRRQEEIRGRVGNDIDGLLRQHPLWSDWDQRSRAHCGMVVSFRCPPYDKFSMVRARPNSRGRGVPHRSDLHTKHVWLDDSITRTAELGAGPGELIQLTNVSLKASVEFGSRIGAWQRANPEGQWFDLEYFPDPPARRIVTYLVTPGLDVVLAEDVDETLGERRTSPEPWKYLYGLMSLEELTAWAEQVVLPQRSGEPDHSLIVTYRSE